MVDFVDVMCAMGWWPVLKLDDESDERTLRHACLFSMRFMHRVRDDTKSIFTKGKTGDTMMGSD